MVASVPTHNLTRMQRNIVERRELGDGTREIARRFSISTSAVRSHECHARKLLSHAQVRLTVLDLHRPKLGTVSQLSCCARAAEGMNARGYGTAEHP